MIRPMRRTISTLALAAVLLPGFAGSAAAKTALTIASVTARDAKVTVKGRVTGLSASRRGHARVALSLTDPAAKVERFSARLTSGGRFTARHRTRLEGVLTLRGRLTVNGHKRGNLATVPAAVSVGGPSGGGAKLVGTFKLDPGIHQPNGTHTGTYFQMFTPGGGPPLTNSGSASTDKNFTTLPPGTDGGLQTFGYQPAPSPAFSATGDSLADRIVVPQDFFGTKFGILTAPTDPQAGTPDPLPEIINTNGTLSGQLTAWAAQWNNQSFNQGSPKPGGGYPGLTTHLTGSLDPNNNHFVLAWKSLIVGGPFNSFIGSWHLEGTFVPQAVAPPSGLPLPLP